MTIKRKSRLIDDPKVGRKVASQSHPPRILNASRRTKAVGRLARRARAAKAEAKASAVAVDAEQVHQVRKRNRRLNI
jgi:hypothetical protein